jgi:hypothetical protein
VVAGMRQSQPDGPRTIEHNGTGSETTQILVLALTQHSPWAGAGISNPFKNEQTTW